jgi:ribose transport system substrate-binding protein
MRARDLGCPLAFVLAVAGCHDQASAPAPGAAPNTAASGTGGSAPAAARRIVIGMSQCNLGEPWRVQMNADLAAAAKKHPNVTLVFKDAQNDSLRQRAEVEELAAAHVDVLVISPKEAAPLTKPVAEVFRQKIPVIVLDRAVEGDEFTAFIGADNQRIGREAGKLVQRLAGEQAHLVELEGLMTSTPAQDRHKGFRDGVELAKHPGLKVVFEADMAWLEPNARKEMESALAANKKIDLVYAHNDPGAHGAYLAAKAAGREHEMKFVGIDALPQEGVRYVKDGILDATFAYPTGGAEAIELALAVAAGKTVPHRVTLGTRLYTKANVDQGGEAIQ